MNKIVVTGVVAVVAAAGAAVFYVATRPEIQDVSQQTAEVASPTQTTQPAADTKSSPAPVVAGKYIAYDQSTFENTSGQRFLFFHAPWCPQCRDLDKSISAQPRLSDNTTIFKVDYDTQNDLRVKYGVTLQTTIVKVDGSGNKLDSFVAYQEPAYSSLAAHFNLQ